MRATIRRAAIAMAVATALGASWGSTQALAQTLFLHHLDVGDPGNNGAGTADYAVGNPNELVSPPNGPGGNTVGPAGCKFGNCLQRFDGANIGGRVEYATAGNWDQSKGTIEMWVKGDGVTGGGFVGLWGTDTSSGSGDIRMYIYDTGAGRTLGAYMLGGTAGAAFWEIEQAIPVGLLDNTNWHSVAWEYDTTAGKTATWWDGQLLRNTPDAGTVNFHGVTNSRMHIGENQTGSAPFPGFIDEFRISGNLVYDMTQNYVPQTAPFPAPVPEPASAALLMIGAVLVISRRLRK